MKVLRWLAPDNGEQGGGDDNFFSNFGNLGDAETNQNGVSESQAGSQSANDRTLEDVLASLPETDREIAEKGLLRQSDYTRKTQDVANKAREYEQGIEELNSFLAELNGMESDTVSKNDLKNLFGKFGKQFQDQFGKVSQTVEQQNNVIKTQQQQIESQMRQKVAEETAREIKDFEKSHPYLSDDMILAVEEVAAAKIRNGEKGVTLEKTLKQVYSDDTLKAIKRQATRKTAIARDQQTSHSSAAGVSDQAVDTSDPRKREMVGRAIINDVVDMVRGR